MILKKMSYHLKKVIIITLLFFTNASAKSIDADFFIWLDNFKEIAKEKGISEKTIKTVLNKSIFLPDVIKYDRFQPEFYEDTKTYIKKRTNKKKVNKGILYYKRKNNVINDIEKKFLVEKELLLALMGIETNYGTYLGKMDIISSLATLSYDKRRRDFFSNELLTLLKLIDSNYINPDILYGSWAGAFGNFQFMPSTIKNHAIDYDKNSIIELKKIEDSFASAANYLNNIGWKKNDYCFLKVELNEDIPQKYLNSSAKKLINKKRFKFFKQYINADNIDNINDNELVAVITPDVDIVPNSKNKSPAYIVFNNYELILKWNRSLRFALAVCTLKNKLRNEI